MYNHAEQITGSRLPLVAGLPPIPRQKREEEGGCGVTGFACSIPVRGRHIFEPSIQMHNRGNGKGGGIAAVGFDAESMEIDAEIIEHDYLLQIAFLDPSAQSRLEQRYITPHFDVHVRRELSHVGDFRDVSGLEVRPPDVWQYFVRVKPEVLKAFSEKHGFSNLPSEKIEDEFVFQNSFSLNKEYYSSLGEQKAFVLSHGKNMMIVKIVGYAEQAVEYYELENFKAHVWIAHQRYPTKGKVWHPGGAHPFGGMHEALVHNGDFANYYSVCEYLRERNIYPLFLTDTEASVLVFDLLNRVYEYPLEYLTEALAPTTEIDFNLLPENKKRIYRMIQATHIHGSPDGPWFFIIARNNCLRRQFQLIGITDTAMLRPQVFAFHEGEVQVGLICSEKQAIDAALSSLSREDPRISPVATRCWNARGGSHSDGGMFSFTVERSNGGARLTCRDKFGNALNLPENQVTERNPGLPLVVNEHNAGHKKLADYIREHTDEECFCFLAEKVKSGGYPEIRELCSALVQISRADGSLTERAIAALTLLGDRYFDPGAKVRSSVIRIVQEALNCILDAIPSFSDSQNGSQYCRITISQRDLLKPPEREDAILVIDATGFDPEGDGCEARLEIEAYRQGWRRMILYNLTGQRFSGCGLGPDTCGVRIDVYGSSGDYLGSGIDGAVIHVHNDAQDQLCQIIKSGTVVIHGSVGQTFMYGAKGGEVYVLGNAAGRPLINAVGNPRVVINGTCLDYLAESFMAGDPLNGGGFVILNGLTFGDHGNVIELSSPYPGNNLFSLASGGAIYVRDPHRTITKESLNGGIFSKLGRADWELILPYLERNERLFGICVKDHLLRVNGRQMPPERVYRKVMCPPTIGISEMDSDDL